MTSFNLIWRNSCSNTVNSDFFYASGAQDTNSCEQFDFLNAGMLSHLWALRRRPATSPDLISCGFSSRWFSTFWNCLDSASIFPVLLCCSNQLDNPPRQVSIGSARYWNWQKSLWAWPSQASKIHHEQEVWPPAWYAGAPLMLYSQCARCHSLGNSHQRHKSWTDPEPSARTKTTDICRVSQTPSCLLAYATMIYSFYYD